MVELRVENNKVFGLEIKEKFEAGLSLSGDEVKSARLGRVGLTGSFVRIVDSQAFVYNLRIDRYSKSALGLEVKRARRLLLKRAEINRLEGLLSQKGRVGVPLRLYSKNNFIKLEIGVGRALKRFEKKEKIKEKEDLRETERILRGKDL